MWALLHVLFLTILKTTAVIIIGIGRQLTGQKIGMGVIRIHRFPIYCKLPIMYAQRVGVFPLLLN